jgi:hypothetical protein
MSVARSPSLSGTNESEEMNMTTRFGPQLIGETEKTLHEILRRSRLVLGLSSN